MRGSRFLKSRFVRRLLVGSVLMGLGSTVLFVGGCVVVASQAQTDFRPIHQPMDPAHQTLIGQIPGYRRPVAASYLSWPEWYLVFNPQDYAQFLHDHPPSGFAYFKSIGQFWGGYAQVGGLSWRNYPFDFGSHLMVVVIGISSTGEYVVKGVYENTVGRLFEFLGSGALTAEDAYAVQVAREYGDFIPTRPWFEFPYGRKFTGLWSTTGLAGPHFLRKCERKIFLSMEYGVKFLYAGVIRLASHTVYGVADTEVYASVTNMPDSAFANPNVKRVRQLGAQAWIITVPHYQGFTDTVPLLARQGVQFTEIAGNDEFLITVVAPAAWKYDLAEGRPLFEMELLAGSAGKRIAIQAPVSSLGAMLREIEAKGLRVEHLYDY